MINLVIAMFINKYIAFLYGLNSFSVRMAEEGTRLSFQYSSSPPELKMMGIRNHRN